VTRRRTIVRVESVRRTFLFDPRLVPCAACGHDVQGVTPDEAARLLQSTGDNLDRFIASGEVHAVDTASGASWICRDSLFRRSS